MFDWLPCAVCAYIMRLRREAMARDRLDALRVETSRRQGVLLHATLKAPCIWQHSQHLELAVEFGARGRDSLGRGAVTVDFFFVDSSVGMRLWSVTLQERVLDAAGGVLESTVTRMTRDQSSGSGVRIAGLLVDTFVERLWHASRNHVWELLGAWARLAHFRDVSWLDSRRARTLRYDAGERLRTLLSPCATPARAVLPAGDGRKNGLAQVKRRKGAQRAW